MNLIFYEYYTEKLINIVCLTFQLKFSILIGLFLKDGLFLSGTPLTIGIINLAKGRYLNVYVSLILEKQAEIL